MDNLEIKASEKSPYVLLDSNNGLIKISGVSDLDDALGFYFPVIQWLDNYVNKSRSNTKVEIEFKYYNTASAKSLFEVLRRIAKLNTSEHKVDVKWYYQSDDEFMVEDIDHFSDIARLPIQKVKK